MPLDTSQPTHYSAFTEETENNSRLSLPVLNAPAPSDRTITPLPARPRLTRGATRLTTNEHYAITPRITLLTGLVIVPTAVLAATFWYVLFHNRNQIVNGDLYSTVPTNVPLFIGTITSTIMSMLSSVVMVLFAYRLGQIWINTELSGSIHNLPSAQEFSLMMKMCSGSSLFVIFEYLLFLSPYELHENGYTILKRYDIHRIKPIMRLTAIIFAITISLTLAVQGADVWVHKTIESATISLLSDTITEHHNYSRVLRPACFMNDTGAASTSLNGFVSTSCVFGADGFLWDPIETFATAANTSNVNAIVNEDDTAYLIPATTSSSVSYKAESIGVTTTCKPITSLCELEYPSSGYASFTCGSGYESLTGLLYSNQGFEVSLLNGTDIVNPFHLGAFGCFKDYAKTFPQVSPTDFLNVSSFNTGIYVGLLQSCTILGCKVELSNLNYTSAQNGDADVLSTNVTLVKGERKRSDDRVTQALTGAISQSYGVEQISLGATSAAVRANSSTAFSSFVALTLSQTILGQSAGAFVGGPALLEHGVKSIIGTRAPLIPICVFLGIQLILIIWCIFIATWSIGVDRSDGAQAIKNARHALIDVKTLVAEHFGEDAVYPPSGRDASLGKTPSVFVLEDDEETTNGEEEDKL